MGKGKYSPESFKVPAREVSYNPLQLHSSTAYDTDDIEHGVGE